MVFSTNGSRLRLLSDEEAGDIKNIPLINLLLLVLKIKSVFFFLFLSKKELFSGQVNFMGIRRRNCVI